MPAGHVLDRNGSPSLASVTKASFHPGDGYEQLSDDDDEYDADGALITRSHVRGPRPTLLNATPSATPPPEPVVKEGHVTRLSKNGAVVAVIDGEEHSIESANRRLATTKSRRALPQGSPERVSHRPVLSVADLTRRIEQLSPYFPVRVEVASNGNDKSGRELLSVSVIGPVIAPMASRLDESAFNGSGGGSGSASQCAEALAELEDLLLSDIDESRVCLFMLHVMDISVTPPVMALGGGGRGGMPLRDDLSDASNPNVDRLGGVRGSIGGSSSNGGSRPSSFVGAPSLLQTLSEAPSSQSNTHAAVAAALTRDVVQQLRETHVDETANVLLLVNHIVEIAPLTHVLFTRCTMQPAELGSAIKLPQSGKLAHLSFSKCPLADAHLLALLRMCNDGDGTASPASLFARLRHLQLSGASLTPDGVAKLVAFIAEAQEEHVGDGDDSDTDRTSGLVFGELVVPGTIADRLRDHDSMKMFAAGVLVNGKKVFAS